MFNRKQTLKGRVELHPDVLITRKRDGVCSIVHTVEESKCLCVCYELGKGRYCRVQQTMNEVI